MTAILEEAPPQAAPVFVRPTLVPEQRLVLQNVGWQSYRSIGDALLDRPRFRMTFDRGTLEFMTTSPLHEMIKMRLGRLLETLVEEFEQTLLPGGSMTFRREDLDRGLEPDQCYWIAHEPAMRMRREWDSKTDPAPDLVIEIEISRSVLDRMSIYAALGVREVWRCDGEAIHVELLQADGRYQQVPDSPTFVGIAVSGILPFLEPLPERDHLATIRAFRERVRQQRGK